MIKSNKGAEERLYKLHSLQLKTWRKSPEVSVHLKAVSHVVPDELARELFRHSSDSQCLDLQLHSGTF